MIACVMIPHLAAALERRKDPALVGVPLVIGGLPWERGKVVDVSGEAAQFGVRPGMSLRQAQALCPEARFIPAASDRYRWASEQLLEVLASFTPRVEPGDSLSAAYLDLGNLKWGEAIKMVQLTGQAVREQARLAPAIGFTGGKFPARVAAEAAGANEALLIAPGCEGAFLAPLPVTHLPLADETARRLHLLGICTLGQLAGLPAGAVLAQFGKEGRFLHQLAQGQDSRPVLPYPPRVTIRAARQLDGPVANWSVLEAVIRAMAKELAGRLQANGQACQEVRVALDLEDGISRQGAHAFRRPASGSDPIAYALTHLLAQFTYPGGVERLEVVLAGLVPATGQQLDLFVHQTSQEGRLGDLLKDLVARYGPNCFYWACLNREARLLEQRFRLLEFDAR
jgi:DNA polymerase-4